jgi:hypothetical protein
VRSFFLTAATIDAVVTAWSPGVFFLGQSDKTLSFQVSFVGRADDDLRTTLKRYVTVYSEFQFVYCSSAREAFEKECSFYHSFRPQDNLSHPNRPKGMTWRCPSCLIYG